MENQKVPGGGKSSPGSYNGSHHTDEDEHVVGDHVMEVYDSDDDDLTVTSHGVPPVQKDQNFEFTNSHNMMRLFRLWVTLQTMALVLDNPSTQLPILFRILCRGVLYYAARFHTRPVIDLVYAFQWFLLQIKPHTDAIPAQPSGIEVEQASAPSAPDSGSAGGVRRHLDAAAYVIDPNPPEPNRDVTISYLDGRSWHAIKAFSHFFLSALACILAVLLTLNFWEIHDYTNRRELRSWIAVYIADGWWRRGLLRLVGAVARAAMCMALFALLLFAIARQFQPTNATPDARMYGGAVGMLLSVVVIAWLLGSYGIRAAESSFVRYVSQNVSYTSMIILKRVIKAKVELGILIMLVVYMPSLYNFTQSFMVIIDWNDSHAEEYRRSVNYFTPCYFMAFPPYTQQNLDPASCAAYGSISAEQAPRDEGFYNDRKILPCDSFLGVTMFTTGLLFFAFLIVFYSFFFYSFVQGAITEYTEASSTSTVRTLYSIKTEMMADYVASFSSIVRWQVDLRDELWAQWTYFTQMSLHGVNATVRLALQTLYLALTPVAGVFYFLYKACYNIWFFMCQKKKKKDEDDDNDEEGGLLGDFEMTAGFSQESSTLVSGRVGAGEHSASVSAGGLDLGALGMDMSQMSGNTRVDNPWQHIPIKHLIDTVNFTDAVYFFVGWFWAKVIFRSLLFCLGHDFFDRLEVKWTLFKKRLKGSAGGRDEQSKKKKSSGSAASAIDMGVRTAGWRKALSIKSKHGKLLNLDKRILDELRESRATFTSDHAMCITVFDTVIDSSGLFMLISQYRWHSMRWTLVLLAEVTIQTLMLAYTSYSVYWITRISYVMYINLSFGVLTYFVKPYTEDVDRWLDFFARLLINLFCLVLPYYHSQVPQGTNDTIVAQMYSPFSSVSYLTGAGGNLSTTAALADAALTAYVYIFTLYICNTVGFFRSMQRQFRAAVFAYHDHILNFLLDKLETRNIGFENIFEGLHLVQQWDDIIFEQRRYGLLPYPDVRPADLVPMSVKLFEMKWASFFNLTLHNMRSSLGLSLLHTTMCGADSEVSRWLIHQYPDLLNVEDFQRDTPLFIALKECSYFLLKYGEQQDFALSDGTSYDDDSYLDYYPEIEDFRDSVISNGEYLPEVGNEYMLDAFELKALDKFGYFVETHMTDKKHYQPSFRDFQSKLSKYATQEEIEAEKAEREKFEAQLNAMDDKNTKKTPEELQAELKAAARAAAAAKASLYKKRFPEDDYQDSFESGQVAAWSVIGLDVPDKNLYIDPHWSRWRYDKKYFDGDLNPTEEELVAEYYEHHKPLDMRYNVKSIRAPVEPGEKAALIPPDDYNLKDMTDWDMPKRKKKTLPGVKQLLQDGKVVVKNATDYALGRVTMSQREEKDREVRFKMCKFAEILLSQEIQEQAKGIEWDLEMFKELNKMAAQEQGRVAQNLAMSCNLQPPARFTRISEWTMGISSNVFDEHPVEDYNSVVKAAVQATAVAGKIAGTIGGMTGAIVKALPNAVDKRKEQYKHHLMDLTKKRAGDVNDQTPGFNDRVIHYLAECFVACRDRLVFKDCELSVAGVRGWRAIARALRRDNCTFVMPSVFVSNKAIITTHIDLSRNELDCGDAVLLADVLLFKQTLQFVDLSYNRIGARGMIRMCQAMKGHHSIKVFHIDHNRIGPAAGREMGIFFKECHHIEVFTASHNRLGELVQYRTLYCRDRIKSAARDIFQGLRKNHHLQILDLSYNLLGPDLADCVPSAVMKHPTLISLNLSGNCLGPEKGALLIFALGNDPGGFKDTAKREAMTREVDRRRLRGEEITMDLMRELQDRCDQGDLFEEENEDADEGAPTVARAKDKDGASKKQKKKKTVAEIRAAEQRKLDRPNYSKLAYIGLADNKLGYMAGHGMSSLVRNCKCLTSLDVSRNNIGYRGGLAFTDGLERVYNLIPRDFNKRALFELEEQKYTGRDALVRKVVYSNLTDLNVSHNYLGPLACQGLMYCVSTKNCTLTSLDVSRNPLGYSIEKAGKSLFAGTDSRMALSENKSLTHLDISETAFLSEDMVPILGALNRNSTLKRFVLRDLPLDEPSCLQAAHGLTASVNITVVDMNNTSMGPKGGLMITNRLPKMAYRLTYLDLSQNQLGPVSCIPIGFALEDSACAIKTLYLQGNNLADEGARFVIKGMKNNVSLTDCSLADNALTGDVAEELADVARGFYRDGKKVCDCQLKRLVISDNPKIGFSGSKLIARAMLSPNFKFVEMANIGAGPGTAKLIADGIRNVNLAWQFADLSGNVMSRSGLNHIFWALRQNRSVRVLLVGDNKAGSIFGTPDDANLGHGVAIQRAIKANVMVRELDLSYNAMCTEACEGVLNAILQNHTIRRLSLRGNKMDDTIADALFDLITFNNVLEELDLGENKLGYSCSHCLGESIGTNRALKILAVDYNELSAAGTSTLDTFTRGIYLNSSMRTLILDGNKLGSSWGVGIAHALARNNTLQQVGFKDNRLDEVAGKALLSSFKAAPFLMEISLSEDEVGATVWDQFRRVFNEKRALFEGDEPMPDLEIMEEINGILEEYYNRPNASLR